MRRHQLALDGPEDGVRRRGREHLGGREAPVGRHEHERVPAREVGQRLDAVAPPRAEAGLGAGEEERDVGAERAGDRVQLVRGRARRAARAAPPLRPTSRRPGRPRPGSASAAARAASRPARRARRLPVCPPETPRRPSPAAVGELELVVAVDGLERASSAGGSRRPRSGPTRRHRFTLAGARRIIAELAGQLPEPRGRQLLGPQVGDLGRAARAGRRAARGSRASFGGGRTLRARPCPSTPTRRPELDPGPAAEGHEHRVDVRLGHEHLAATPRRPAEPLADELHEHRHGAVGLRPRARRRAARRSRAAPSRRSARPSGAPGSARASRRCRAGSQRSRRAAGRARPGRGRARRPDARARSRRRRASR